MVEFCWRCKAIGANREVGKKWECDDCWKRTRWYEVVLPATILAVLVAFILVAVSLSGCGTPPESPNSLPIPPKLGDAKSDPFTDYAAWDKATASPVQTMAVVEFSFARRSQRR